MLCTLTCDNCKEITCTNDAVNRKQSLWMTMLVGCWIMFYIHYVKYVLQNQTDPLTPTYHTSCIIQKEKKKDETTKTKNIYKNNKGLAVLSLLVTALFPQILQYHTLFNTCCWSCWCCLSFVGESFSSVLESVSLVTVKSLKHLFLSFLYS